MIELRDIHKIYKMGEHELHALQGVSLTIEPGEFVAIMGPSGSGKSTLMHILGLLDHPDGGSYRLFGREVSQLSEDELATLRSQRIGFIFQQFNLLARTSAAENVGLPLIYSSGRHDAERAAALLNQVGLGERLEHKPNELSGGQQQRVAIARSLVNQPDIIFADEPTGNLDSASEAEILKILTDLNQHGITVIIVTHEAEVARCVKRVIKMRDGRIISDEPTVPQTPQTMLPSEAHTHGTLRAVFPATQRAAGLGRIATAMSMHTRQALKSLWANKVRSALSMLGILIGVAAVIAMLAVGAGASQSIENQLSSLGSNLMTLRNGSMRQGGVSLGIGAAPRLAADDAPAIATLRGVKRTAAAVSGRAQIVYGNKNWSTQVTGTTVNYEGIRSAKPAAGRFFTDEEDRKRARVVLLGKKVVNELFGDASPLGEMVKVNRVSFQVIGVLPEKGGNSFMDQDDVIVMPLNTAMRRLLGKDSVDSIDIEALNAKDMDGLEDAVKNLLMTRHRLRPEQAESFVIHNMAEIQEAMNSTTKVLSILLAVIASISLVVGGIGIMNIMLVSVAERTREIGLRKAVGATRADILLQFLVESAVVSILGGALGIAIGWSAAMILSKVSGWPVVVSGGSILLSVLFSTGIGIVFGLWPAKQASALHPIQALRHE